MFFWMMLASLLGVVMFGNWQEKTKDQSVFVTPVYQAMALSTYQQHVAAEQGYLDAMRINPDGTNNYLNTHTDGIVPLVTVEGNTMSAVTASNTVYSYIQGRLPPTYQPQNNTRTYLFCVPKTQQLPGEHAGWCNDSEMVRYIITMRPIPAKYDGSNKMSALKAIGEATGYSRFVGMLQKSNTPLANTGSTTHQPLGAYYYILSSGVAPVASVYIPNYVVCNFPLKNNDSTTLGDSEPSGYIAALSLVSGLPTGQNLTIPASNAATCPAIPGG